MARIFLRELLRNKRFVLFFAFNLGIGLSGFLLVETLRNSISKAIHSQARKMLAGDLSVSARRAFSDSEIAIIKAAIPVDGKTSWVVDFFTMATRGETSQLLQVRSVDDNYPLVGNISYRGTTESFGKVLKEGPNVILNSDLFPETDKEEPLSLGGFSYRVAANITEDPTQSFRGFALGGRAFLHQDQLQKTTLLQFGSTVNYSLLILCSSSEVAKELKQKLKSALMASDIKISTSIEAAESSVQSLAYLGDFMGLVSLISILLSSLGVYYLFQAHLDKSQKNLAIFRALGLSAMGLRSMIVFQLFTLSLISLVPALGIVRMFLPVFERKILQWSSIQIPLTIDSTSLISLVALAVFGLPLLLLPQLLRLGELSPLRLFREEEPTIPWSQRWLFLPAIVFFLLLSFYVCRSSRNLYVFWGVLAGLMVALALLFWLITFLMNQRMPRDWLLKHSILYLLRNAATTRILFFTLTIGTALLLLLPQLESSIREELNGSKSLPSIFFFDIQESLLPELESFLKSRNHPLQSVSPLVRARIVNINGKNIERVSDPSAFRTREEEQEERTKNRSVNLSYRNHLQESEKIWSGRPFSAFSTFASGSGISSGQEFEISVERKYAERLGVKVADLIVFDVQGMEIKGRIVNLRSVKWTSFQPNFFILFQEGVLEEVPKIFLANLPVMPNEEKLEIKKMIIKKFRNLAMVDVSKSLDSILDLLAKMRFALAAIGLLAVFSGISVLCSILAWEIQKRSGNLVLLKLLGASNTDLRKMLLIETLLVGFFSVLIGAGGSIVFTYTLCVWVFDGAFRVDFFSLLAISLVLWIFLVVVTLWNCRRIERLEPLVALRGIS